jgi:hypothetical protein
MTSGKPVTNHLSYGIVPTNNKPHYLYFIDVFMKCKEHGSGSALIKGAEQTKEPIHIIISIETAIVKRVYAFHVGRLLLSYLSARSEASMHCYMSPKMLVPIYQTT